MKNHSCLIPYIIFVADTSFESIIMFKADLHDQNVISLEDHDKIIAGQIFAK